VWRTCSVKVISTSPIITTSVGKFILKTPIIITLYIYIYERNNANSTPTLPRVTLFDNQVFFFQCWKVISINPCLPLPYAHIILFPLVRSAQAVATGEIKVISTKLQPLFRLVFCPKIPYSVIGIIIVKFYYKSKLIEHNGL
jgi:hypothetical protein